VDSFPTIDLTSTERTQGERRSMRRYWIFFGIAGIFVIFGLVSLYYHSQKISATKISDTAFAKKADAICRSDLLPLINRQPQQGENLTTPKIVKRVNQTADGMEKIRTKLAAIPVAAADQTAVNEWLNAWGRYIADGRRYADALYKNDKAAYKIGNASANNSAKITAFAIVNHIDSCELRTQTPASSI
jgi:hypothetical protein